MLAATIKAPAVIPAGFIILDAVRRAPADRRRPRVRQARRVRCGRVRRRVVGVQPGLGLDRRARHPRYESHAAHAHDLPRALDLGGRRPRNGGAQPRPHRGRARPRSSESPTSCGAHRRSAPCARAGYALALIVALGPIVLPWYVLWGLVVLAAVGRRIERGFAIFASVVLSIVVQPSGSVDARRRVDGRGRRADRARDRDRMAARARVDPQRPRGRRSRSTAGGAASRRPPTCCASRYPTRGRPALARRIRPPPERRALVVHAVAANFDGWPSRPRCGVSAPVSSPSR